MLQSATSLGQSVPWTPNISDEHVSCTAPATRNASLQILFKCPMPAIIFGMSQNSHVLLTFDKAHNPSRLPRETTSERPKVIPTCGVLKLLTWKCASRQNGVQWRALFRHLNFQRCSENGVFCTFWLRKLLHATTACNLSSLIWPDGSAPAALPSLLFDPPEPQSIGKTVFRDFSTFSRARIFFLLTLSLLWSSSFFSSLLWLFPPLLFHLSILSEAWLLNFLRSGIFHWIFDKQNNAIKEGYGVEIVFQLNWVTDAISVGNFAVIFSRHGALDFVNHTWLCCLSQSCFKYEHIE